MLENSLGDARRRRTCSEGGGLLGERRASSNANNLLKRDTEDRDALDNGAPRRTRQRRAETRLPLSKHLCRRVSSRARNRHRPYFLARRTKICCYIDRAGKRDGGKAMAGREEQDGEGEVSTTTRMTSDEGEILMSGTRRRCCGPAFVHSARPRSMKTPLASRADPGREI